MMRLHRIGLAIAWLAWAPGASAGNLEPSGPPAPTMSTLEQVAAALASITGGAQAIDQACAETTGCFAGDTAGFPVTINAPGSYALTSRLDLSATPATNAIVVSAPSVHIDLRGFEIAGPTSCTGSGATLSCSPTGSGSGVEFQASAEGSSVSNGTIRGMGYAGISASPPGMRVTNVVVHSNGLQGITAAEQILVTDSILRNNHGDGLLAANGIVRRVISAGNGNDGIRFLAASGLVSESSALDNGDQGFELAVGSRFGHDNTKSGNVNGNSCGGGICTPRKRYYATAAESSDGNNACDPGFHWAGNQPLLTKFAGMVHDSRPSAQSYPLTTCAFVGPGTYGKISDEDDSLDCDLSGTDITCLQSDIARSAILVGQALIGNAAYFACQPSNPLPSWCVED